MNIDRLLKKANDRFENVEAICQEKRMKARFRLERHIGDCKVLMQRRMPDVAHISKGDCIFRPVDAPYSIHQTKKLGTNDHDKLEVIQYPKTIASPFCKKTERGSWMMRLETRVSNHTGAPVYRVALHNVGPVIFLDKQPQEGWTHLVVKHVSRKTRPNGQESCTIFAEAHVAHDEMKDNVFGIDNLPFYREPWWRSRLELWASTPASESWLDVLGDLWEEDGTDPGRIFEGRADFGHQLEGVTLVRTKSDVPPGTPPGHPDQIADIVVRFSTGSSTSGAFQHSDGGWPLLCNLWPLLEWA